jgi:hypothetical protein
VFLPPAVLEQEESAIKLASMNAQKDKTMRRGTTNGSSLA